MDAGNPAYQDLDGVLFDVTGSILIRYPAGRSGFYRIPDGVVTIGDDAFFNCPMLTGVSIPQGVARVGNWSFGSCPGLTRVALPSSVVTMGDYAFAGSRALTSLVFLGDAPTFDTIGLGTANPGLVIHYLGSRSGFSSPMWQGYPAEEINESVYPAAAWLEMHGMPFNALLDQDVNHDGVTLLVAYALDLDPANAHPGVPKAVVGADALSMRFYASARGVTYTVQRSSDLSAWTTDGITLTEMDEEGRVTASTPITPGRQFMRIMIEH